MSDTWQDSSKNRFLVKSKQLQNTKSPTVLSKTSAACNTETEKCKEIQNNNNPPTPFDRHSQTFSSASR